MKYSYRYIVLTRFNLQYDLQSTLHIQPAYLDNRLSLFEKYCLPSMQQQTNKEFVWLLLADANTPQPQRQRLLSYEQIMPQIQVLFCPYYADFNQMYRQIGEQYGAGYDWLLSTRLDNDDMLADDFAEELHTYMRTHQPKECVLTYPIGVQYFANDDIAFRVRFDNNHFLTFLEPADHIRTALGADHTQVPKESLLPIGKGDAWCEIVHGGNMCNDYVPKYHYYRRSPQGHYPTPMPATTWKRRTAFLARHWLAFRAAQVMRAIMRLCSACVRSV